ncbi:MAG: DUF4105 domain-containing protein [Desulfuromonadaceae bacterium]|nr:DUF4105 domain-containing protein [Desulfuromonadaceae bacterium]
MISIILKSRFFFHFPRLLVLMTGLIGLPLPALCANPEYVSSLIREAARLKLYEDRGWRALLHYGKNSTGSYRSKIDDSKFFNSPVGRINPEAELEATLQSFFLVDLKDGQSSLCRFPGRFAWLDEHLHIDQSQLPSTVCSERDSTFEAIGAQSAVLVFPVGHINSPASMFGHTLIRIDGKSRSRLISYAVNYSAANTDSNGLAYAWKGLTGMYKGFYSLMPYYDKVREYNDLEHRDIWEYKLNLTAPEVKRMLEHIWELQNIESSYYFLDENCSYNLMFLMEVARPELQLTEKAGYFVLPSDTVQIAMANGIIGGVSYRPSQGTKIRKIISLLKPDEQTIAYDISFMAEDPSRVISLPVSTIEKIKILDLAAGFVQYRFGRKEIEKDVYSRLYLKILSVRSGLGNAPEDIYTITEPVSPDKGHGTTRISSAIGVHRGTLFGELNVRPEFHSLRDPDQGYLPGAQIKFLDTALRYGGGSKNLYLNSLYILDIISIAPRDTFFKPVSWKINTGFDKELLHNRQEHLIYHLNSGGGFSYSTPFEGIYYLFGELMIQAGHEFRAGITAAPGLSVGMVEQLSSSTKLLLGVAGYWYRSGEDRTSVKATVSLNQRLTQNNSLSLEALHEYMNSTTLSEVSLRWNFYY